MVAATLFVVVVGLVVRWARAGTGVDAAVWAADPIGPDDLAG
ncbi:hypothetical protein [Rhodococcus olei]